MIPQILVPVLIIGFILGLFCFIFYSKKGNWIDYTMKKKSKHQIGLLMAFVLIVFLMLMLIHVVTVPTFGNDKPDTYLYLFGLFSQTENADHKQSIAVYIFQLLVSLIGAVCFGGILISTISNIFQRRVDSYTKGEVRYTHLHGHNIIIGANELLEPAMRHMKFDKKDKREINRVTLVLTTADAEKTRARIRQMGVIDDKNLIIYRDNIFNNEVIKPLCLSKCKQVVIIGDELVENCDIDNTNTADLIYNHIASSSKTSKRKKPIPVYVSFFDDAYFLSFCKNSEKTSSVYFYPFNYYELCIANVWGFKQLEAMQQGESKARCRYPGLSNPSDRKPLHLYLLGLNAMGQEVLKAVVKWAHFLNSTNHVTQISVYTGSRDTLNKFQRRYPHVNGNLFDMNINFTVQSPYAKETMDELEKAVHNTEERPYIVVCSDNNSNNFMLATHLPSLVYKREVPTLVQFDHNNDTIQKGFHVNNTRFNNVHFFGFHNNDLPFSFGLKAAQRLLYLHAQARLSNNANEDKEEERKHWEKKPYNAVRQTHICCVHGLPTLLQELGLSIVKESDNVECIDKSSAKDILQRIYMGWHVVAGNMPTDSPQSESDEENGRLNELFTYDVLKTANSESFSDRDKRLEEYIKEIQQWLKENGKSLQKTSFSK